MSPPASGGSISAGELEGRYSLLALLQVTNGIVDPEFKTVILILTRTNLKQYHTSKKARFLPLRFTSQDSLRDLKTKLSFHICRYAKLAITAL